MKDHRLIDERSLAFSHLIADKLRADPALVRHARGNLERWLRDCSERSRPALLEWRELLDGPVDELLSFLISTGERAAPELVRERLAQTTLPESARAARNRPAAPHRRRRREIGRGRCSSTTSIRR